MPLTLWAVLVTLAIVLPCLLIGHYAGLRAHGYSPVSARYHVGRSLSAHLTVTALAMCAAAAFAGTH
jgi:hypothetical protein